MKIIDLLNKIANGENVPKKIRYEDIIYTYNEYDKDYFEIPISEDEYRGLFNMKDSILTQYLNDEVEIIEDTPKVQVEMTQEEYFEYLDEYLDRKLDIPKEDKKINKLDYCEENTLSNLKEITCMTFRERQLIDSNFKTIKEKFDEIIERLNGEK